MSFVNVNTIRLLTKAIKRQSSIKLKIWRKKNQTALVTRNSPY